MFALRFQYWLYSTKTLKLFYGLRLLLTFGFLGAVLLGFGLNLAYVFAVYGMTFVTLSFSPLLVLGLVMIIWAIVKKRYQMITPFLILMFIPITFFSEYGLTANIYLLALVILRKIEKTHRTYAVKVLSYFSKTYSPLYDKRLANKNAFRSYQYAYRVLECLQEDDYQLLIETTTTTNNKKTGITEKTMERTFKIKGIWGKVTIKDELYSQPYKKNFFSKSSI